MKQNSSSSRRKKWPFILLAILLLGVIGKIASKNDPDLYVDSSALDKPLDTLVVMPTPFPMGTENPSTSTPQAIRTAASTVKAVPPTQATRIPAKVTQPTIAELEQISGIEYKKGSSGAGVRQIQEWLIALQYLPAGENDGKYGNKTAAAVSSFQAIENLTVSGIATIATQYRLAEKAATFITTSRGAHRTGTDDYGIVTWDDSSFYIGTFQGNAINGKGTFYFAGRRHYYVGAFDNGCRKGKGEMSFANGDFYTGEWKDDLMEGDGTYYFGKKNSSEQYVGKWAHGTMTGSGTYTLSDGRKIKGTWLNNSFVQ